MTIENKEIQLTEDHLVTIFGSSASGWYTPLWQYMQKYQITNMYRIAMFFGNIGPESGNFTRLEENLNYSAQGLVKTFPSKFPSESSAAPYARNPQKIANKVYANKIGNGSEASGDGWKHRGRGLIQITGKANIAAFDRKEPSFKALSDPSVLTTKEGASASACWFWADKGLNRQADSGSWSVCVKRVNAAGLHMEKRTAMYKRALSVLSGEEVEELPESTGDNASYKDTPDSRYGSISEPRSGADPKYPFNKVYESQSGHCIEVDDTPNAERIMIFHMSGSYIEFRTEGDIVIKAHKDLYLLANGAVQKLQKEDHAEVVEGQSAERSDKKVIKNNEMTIESQDFQINSPTSISKPLDAVEAKITTFNATDAVCESLVCNAPVAMLTASSALVANSISPGSPQGSMMQGLSKSIQMEYNPPSSEASSEEPRKSGLVDSDGGEDDGIDFGQPEETPKQGDPNKMTLTVPLETAGGLLFPTLDEVPESFNGIFICNGTAYIGAGNVIIPIGGATTGGESGG